MPGARTLTDIGVLAAIDRESASDGEARAARELGQMLTARGLRPVLESERAVGGFWQSSGLAAAAAVLAGSLGARSRLAGAAFAVLTAGLIADDVDNARHLLRRVLPKRRTSERARVGRRPRCPGDDRDRRPPRRRSHRAAVPPGAVPLVEPPRPRVVCQARTPPPRPAACSFSARCSSPRQRRGQPHDPPGRDPLERRDGAPARRRRPLARGGGGERQPQRGGRAARARRAPREDPAPGVRVLLLSTGSEESFMEGMRALHRRHSVRARPGEHPVPRARVRRFAARIVIMEGEGMLRMRDSRRGLREEVQAAADEAGIVAVARPAAGRRWHRRAARAEGGLSRRVPGGLHGPEGALQLPLAERRRGEPGPRDDRAGSRGHRALGPRGRRGPRRRPALGPARLRSRSRGAALARWASRSLPRAP